jgi:hypothetical protein
MSRLFEKYKKEVVPALQKEFSIKNKMAVPRLEKIILNVGVGDAIQNIKFLDTAKKELSFITGQWAATGRAKKSISSMLLPVMLLCEAKECMSFLTVWSILYSRVSGISEVFLPDLLMAGEITLLV